MKIINRRNIILITGLVLCALTFVYFDARFTAYLVILFALVFLGALFCSLLTGRSMSLDARCQVQGTKGNPAEATLTISNRSRLPVITCTAAVTVRNHLTGEKDREKYSFCIPGKKSRELKILIKPKYCGCMGIRVEKLEVSDPFRLFSRKVNAAGIESEGAGAGLDLCRSYFMPQTMETWVSPEDVSAYNMESYKYSTLSRGSDPAETFDIKAYERGDSYKAIHWKLSSKTDELVIREFGLPIENNVLILLDKNRGEITPAEADSNAEFTASISYTLLGKEVNHTIGWFDSESGTFETARVENMDSFWNAMKNLISSPFAEDSMSVADRYIESDAGKDYSAYLLISSEGKDMEKLMAYGQVDLYRPEDFR